MQRVSQAGLRAGKILGIPIFINSSWLVIFALITWSLAIQFTRLHPRWNPAQHWTVGVVTSLLFFASVVFHELAHSLVARLYKIRVVSITLFIFGGVARIEGEPAKPLEEFNIAIAGPASSFLLAGFFFSLTRLFPNEQMLGALCTFLFQANFLLAAFNLIPGFPLDGGRVLRAMVWALTKNFVKATTVAGTCGKFFAYTLILIGLWIAFGKNNFRSGVWLAFIGWFLLDAAQSSMAQVTIQQTLSGLRAFDVMSHEVPTMNPSATLEDYGNEVVRTGRRAHLVISDSRLLGLMDIETLNAVPREEWPHTSVQAVMLPREQILWARPEDPLLGLLERLLAADVNQVPVVSGSSDGSAQIIGMVTRDSILRVIQTRTELGPLQAVTK